MTLFRSIINPQWIEYSNQKKKVSDVQKYMSHYDSNTIYILRLNKFFVQKYWYYKHLNVDKLKIAYKFLKNLHKT